SHCNDSIASSTATQSCRSTTTKSGCYTTTTSCYRCSQQTDTESFSSSEQCPGIKPTISSWVAASQSTLRKSCERICNFDVLNKKTVSLTAMFLGTDPCPQSYGLDLMQCAAQSRDHTECCIERGVQTTSAGNKCPRLLQHAAGQQLPS
ncbi:DB module, partial [Ostertagia ostertagi]